MAFNTAPLEKTGEYRGMLAIQVAVPERMAFLRKVYSLFGLTLVVFAGSAWLASTNQTIIEHVVMPIFSMGWIGLIVLMMGMFLVLRMTASSFPINVVALLGFGVVEGLITAPLLMAIKVTNPETSGTIIAQAGVLTGVVFGGLTLFTLTSKKDFSFMRTGLWAGFFILFGAMILGLLFGVNVSQIGISIGWVVLMAGFMIYDTSNIMRHYPTNMAAAAAVKLFLDVVIMFQHLLMLLGGRRN